MTKRKDGPERCLDHCINAGVDWLLIHIEACVNPAAALATSRRGVARPALRSTLLLLSLHWSPFCPSAMRSAS